MQQSFGVDIVMGLHRSSASEDLEMCLQVIRELDEDDTLEPQME